MKTQKQKRTSGILRVKLTIIMAYLLKGVSIPEGLKAHSTRAVSTSWAEGAKNPIYRYWWLKISALAEKEDWEELENFSKTKKSPIGYLPYVEICMKYRNKVEAKKYIARVSPEQRVKAFLLVGNLDQAAEAAIEHKNENEMNMVLSKCSSITDSSATEKIERAKAQLLKK